MDEDVDHAVRRLNRRRPDLLRPEHPETAALDHGRTTHADVRILRRDDDVAAPEQCRIAGEAATRNDADEGDQAAQPAEEVKRHRVQPGYRRGVGVAWTSATPLREDRDREAPLLR